MIKMKRILVVLFAVMISLQGNAQKVLRDDNQKLQVKYEMGILRMEETTLEGRNFTRLTAEGCMSSAVQGAPNLPTFSTLIEVPLCEGYEVTVSESVYDTMVLKGSPVMPLQPSRSKSDMDRHAMTIDGKIYSTNAFYGVEMAQVVSVGVARDRNLARLQFSPVQYNPVTGQLVVCRSAVVTVNYIGSNVGATQELFERYHSEAFASGEKSLNSLYPKSVRTSAPIRYLIVAHSMFRGQLDSFVQWKRRKGFITDIVYTDETAVGTTSTSIANYIKSQYTNATTASPAPTYLLIVGDHEQIPAFSARVTSPSSSHITDLYYACWTSGDNIPDCYYGRFSAQTVAQLTPQIEKTLMYEQYTFADPSFLDRAVMVAGVDGGSSGDFGYTHADPAMDYAVTNYVNGAHGFSQVKYFKNNTSIVPTGSNITVGSSASSNSATVRGYYNEGAGLINYSAHGSATSWGTPNFTTTHAAAMTNSQKFGLMIGNCCLTNKFETSTCLGESVLRKGDYCGAVGYIGGSNSTYWDEDFYWAVGVRSSIGPSMSLAYNSSNLGVYDRAFHTHSEAYSGWVKTQGEMLMQGNMAVESSTSSYNHYYWEIYHLMGDPSVMPYLTQASDMTVSVASTIPVGTTSLTVVAAPYAYVALTDTATRTLKASGFANASGSLTLTLPSNLTVGGYELAVSAQQYKTSFRSISVIPTNGAYPQVVSVTPQNNLAAGATVQLSVKVANIGNSNASNVTVALTSDNVNLTITGSSLNISSIPAGDTVTRTVTAIVGSQVEDGTLATLTTTTNCTSLSSPISNTFPFTLTAPVVAIAIDNRNPSVLPGGGMTVAVTLSNTGHAMLGSSQLVLSSPNSQVTVTPASNSSFTLAASASITRQFTIQVASSMTLDVTVPLTLQLTGPVSQTETLNLYVGENYQETFEGGHFVLSGWTQGEYPWTVVSSGAQQGSYCARSSSSLSHNQTSEMSISVNVARTDSVSFYYKVSSEANYDKFHFYIDDDEKVVNSGDVDWTRAAFLVTPGSHTFKFTYAKDRSVNSNSDCAWVDNISLPHPVPNYVVSVTAPHGTAVGAGSYPQGENISVGVFPQAGYTFVGWTDGAVANPRQVTVNGNLHFVATLAQGEVVTIHDTTVVTQHDTTVVTITQHDTTVVTVTQHDTTVVTVIQHDTTVVTQHDTTTIVLVDTVTVYVEVPVHDTTYVFGDTVFIEVPVHDTAYFYDTVFVHDTSYVDVYLYDTISIHDTTYLNIYVHDTAYVNVFIHDTAYVNVFVHDTTYIDVYIHDTTLIVDTVIETLFDTVINVLYDTVERFIYDTVVLTDTLWRFDTIFIHDTVYITVGGIEDALILDVKIYQREGGIEVEGAEGYPVTLYDAVGRKLEEVSMTTALPVRLSVRASGVYLVKVGDLPARRVVVIR